MKKLLVLIVTACALALPATAQSAATTVKVPFEADITACNGDTIHLSGPLLIVLTETPTPSGGFIVSEHFQPQGITGVDLQTGTTFIGTGLTRDIVIFSPPGGIIATALNRFHIQATRGEESFIVSSTFHITVLPDGTVTTVVDNFSSTC